MKSIKFDDNIIPLYIKVGYGKLWYMSFFLIPSTFIISGQLLYVNKGDQQWILYI